MPLQKPRAKERRSRRSKTHPCQEWKHRPDLMTGQRGNCRPSFCGYLVLHMLKTLQGTIVQNVDVAQHALEYCRCLSMPRPTCLWKPWHPYLRNRWFEYSASCFSSRGNFGKIGWQLSCMSWIIPQHQGASTRTQISAKTDIVVTSGRSGIFASCFTCGWWYF